VSADQVFHICGQVCGQSEGVAEPGEEQQTVERQSTTLWQEFQQRVQAQLPATAYQTWIDPLISRLDGDVLMLEAPTVFHLRWVRDRYQTAVEEAALAVFGPEVKVEFSTIDPGDRVGDGEVDIRIDITADKQAANAPPRREPPPPAQDLESRLVAKYTFDNFVVGKSNHFAQAAALAVAEEAGSHYNPLFIYGGAGLGKTHLLHAVGHLRRELAPGTLVRYVSSEQFFNEFVNGIRQKRMDEFKARYRTIDVLLLDDVQFFEGKELILEEFFHTFNSLYEAGKHLVISSDRPPRNFSTLEDRLSSRFAWGLQTDIQPPDVETRLAILRKNAEFAPMEVPKTVLEFIATHVANNIRELEGALTRVTAFAALTHERITLEMAEQVLSDLLEDNKTPVTATSIINLTAARYSLSEAELTGPSRKQPLARSRQIAMYLCRELTDLSLPKIGSAFGGRDHSTVLHAVEKIKNMMQSDKQVYDEVSDLSQRLRRS
jgi:chromosomal replication initiator protein